MNKHWFKVEIVPGQGAMIRQAIDAKARTVGLDSLLQCMTVADLTSTATQPLPVGACDYLMVKMEPNHQLYAIIRQTPGVLHIRETVEDKLAIEAQTEAEFAELLAMINAGGDLLDAAGEPTRSEVITTTTRDWEAMPPFLVTEDNLDEVRALYPDLHILYTKCCPVCRSYLIYWYFTEYQEWTDASLRILTGCKIICPNCKKLTVADPTMPDNDNSVLHGAPFEPVWVRCPHCRRGFQLKPEEWTGQRHRRCGRRLIIEETVES